MLFQSQGFILLFLPVAVLSYYLVAGSVVTRQYVLIAASLFFYGWWDVRFIPLLVGQIGATWLMALLAARAKSRLFLFAGIFVNLMALGTFKYFDFITKTLEAVTATTLPHANLALPIGISFF